MSFQPRTRLQKILMGIAATPRTALEHAVKYAVDNAGGGGGGDIVRVPFTLDATQAEISGSTDAVFADALADRKAGKLIIATGTVNIGLDGVTQYFDCIMSGIDAGNDSRLEGVFLMLSGSGTKLEAYDLKWTSAGVEVSKKDIAVS